MTRPRKKLSSIVADAAECACGHRADEHGADLPAPCLHGHDGATVDPRKPGYGCQCIGFTFRVPPSRPEGSR